MGIIACRTEAQITKVIEDIWGITYKKRKHHEPRLKVWRSDEVGDEVEYEENILDLLPNNVRNNILSSPSRLT